MSADHCSFWPEGAWARCCEIHDASTLNFAAHIDLGLCVAGTGYPAMGVVMATGCILFSGVYGWVKHRRKR